MGRHVMDLAAFLVEAHPQAFFWRNRSPTLTPSAADTRAKVKTISPSNARSRKPARLLVSIEHSSSPASSAERVGGLPFVYRLSRRAQREDGIMFEDAARHQIVEEHPHGRHVLLLRRNRALGSLHRFEIRRPMQRPDILERGDIVVGQKIEERGTGGHVRLAGVLIADRRTEEL